MINTITLNKFAVLCSCTLVGRASDSINCPDIKLIILVNVNGCFFIFL